MKDPNQDKRKAAAFDWLDEQVQSYGMRVKPYRAGIGLIAIAYTDHLGERRHSMSGQTLLDAVENAMQNRYRVDNKCRRK